LGSFGLSVEAWEVFESFGFSLSLDLSVGAYGAFGSFALSVGACGVLLSKYLKQLL
jgi:hypothetical protein